jgi:hypothetical protein
LWDSSYTAGYILNSYELPKVLMNTEFMRQKMSNFYGLRTEMEFTIKINPTPFIAGALAVVLHPTGTSPSQLSSWTYYPHELINLPIVNNATISIPYFSELEAYILPNDAPWTVSLIVVSPLRSAASSLTLEVNAFVRFKNPELMVPVLNNLIPGPTMTIDTVVSKRRAHAQAGESNELQEQKEGLITRVSGSVADVLEAGGTALSKIPVVGPFVPPLTWAVRAFNKVSSYFGWCKPANIEIARLFTPIPAARMCNAEGVDNGVVLGLAPDNTVNSNQNYTDMDEMSLSYILERKYISQVQSWTAGSDIKTISLNLVNNTTSTNVLKAFNYLRYMRCFEFHFVKTNFHTGRILIQYDYNNSIATIDDAKVAMTSVYSKIVDLSVQDRFVFTIPWMDLSPFDYDMPGQIVLSTFNDIVAAETVNAELDIVVYESYRDCQLGLPLQTTQWEDQNPIVFSAKAQSVIDEDFDRDNLIDVEDLDSCRCRHCARCFCMFGIKRVKCKNRPRAQSSDCSGNGAPIPTDDLIPYKPQSMEQYCMGETFTNLRSLAKRFTFANEITLDGNGILTPKGVLGSSAFACINSMYYGRSGSIRLKLVFPRHLILKIELATPDTFNAIVYTNAVQIFTGSMSNVAEVTIPYYYPRRRCLNHFPWPDVQLSLYDKNNTSTTGIIQIYTAAGDDYNGMFLKGLDPAVNTIINGYYGIIDGDRKPFFGFMTYDGTNFGFDPAKAVVYSPVPGSAGNLAWIWNPSDNNWHLWQWPSMVDVGLTRTDSKNLPALPGSPTCAAIPDTGLVELLLFSCIYTVGLDAYQCYVPFKGYIITDPAADKAIRFDNSHAVIFISTPANTSNPFVLVWGDDGSWYSYTSAGVGTAFTTKSSIQLGLAWPGDVGDPITSIVKIKPS